MDCRKTNGNIPAMAKGAPKPVTRVSKSVRRPIRNDYSVQLGHIPMKAQYLQKKYLVRGLKGMLERGPSA